MLSPWYSIAPELTALATGIALLMMFLFIIKITPRKGLKIITAGIIISVIMLAIRFVVTLAHCGMFNVFIDEFAYFSEITFTMYLLTSILTITGSVIFILSPVDKEC